MGQNSNIDWTDDTWNPIRGCTAVSPGCKNCYAAKVAKRFSGPGKPFEGLVRINAAGERTDEWNGNITFVEKHLLDPLKWCPAEIGGPYGSGPGRPRRIFVNSVSDLFHENLDRKHLVSIFAVMALCPQHRFQVLTKRHERMAEVLYHGGEALKVEVQMEAGFLLAKLFAQDSGFSVKAIRAILDRLKATARNEHDEIVIDYINPVWPLRNVIVGVSVENQEWADKRWEPLYLVSKVGWRTMVSYEPALGPVDWHDGSSWGFLDWLISGGESQAGARPSHPAWHQATRDFAAEYGIAYFFKQWGDWGPGSMHMTSGERVFREFISHAHWAAKGNTWVNGGRCFDAEGKECKNGGDMASAVYPVTVIHRVGKKAAGHLLDGKAHRAFPEGF